MTTLSGKRVWTLVSEDAFERITLLIYKSHELRLWLWIRGDGSVFRWSLCKYHLPSFALGDKVDLKLDNIRDLQYVWNTLRIEDKTLTIESAK
jgi:hypothetical protein